jgi:hypothetical protein
MLSAKDPTFIEVLFYKFYNSARQHRFGVGCWPERIGDRRDDIAVACG